MVLIIMLLGLMIGVALGVYIHKLRWRTKDEISDQLPIAKITLGEKEYNIAPELLIVVILATLLVVLLGAGLLAAM